MCVFECMWTLASHFHQQLWRCFGVVVIVVVVVVIAKVQHAFCMCISISPHGGGGRGKGGYVLIEKKTLSDFPTAF